MIDLQLLRIFKNRTDLFKLYKSIPRETLDPTTVQIVDDLHKYFNKYPSREAVDLNEFISAFWRWHTSVPEEKRASFNAVFRSMTEKEADEDARKNIIGEIAELELATHMANLAERHAAGDVANIFGDTTRIMDEYRDRVGFKDAKFIDTPIGDLLQKEADNSGYSWRLQCLNRSMRGLRPGDFGILAGRPDKGKTSFIASEVTFIAPQLPDDQNILWLNNEGLGERIIPRLYQAALNYTLTDMIQANREGKLVDQYRAAMGGRIDRIQVFDIHGWDNGQVESVLQETNPGVVVYDMIDNIKGFGSEARTDLALEEMYKWARERCVKYHHVGIATSQISNDGDGMQFPTLGMLKDSKTGKQGACDFQIMIGASNDPNLDDSRFIGVPKNKLRRQGNASDPRADVRFDKDRCRYVDREQVITADEAEELIPSGKAE